MNAGLAIAACGGCGDFVTERAPAPGEIRLLTGLSAPAETPEAAGIFEQSGIRRRLRRDAAAGARSVHRRRRRAAWTPTAGLIPGSVRMGIGQGYPRMQLLTVGEIIDGARCRTPGAAGRVDQATLPLP